MDRPAREFALSLTPEEKQLFEASRLATALLAEVAEADQAHAQASTTRRHSAAILLFVAGIEQYGKCLDVFANANELLCPIWGGIRVILHLAKQFGEYFAKLTGMLESIGEILDRMPRYARLYPDNARLRQGLTEMYRAVFDFCAQARDTFRIGTSRSKTLRCFKDVVTVSATLRLVWKPFETQFGEVQERIKKGIEVVSVEADLTEREMTRQETQKMELRALATEKSQKNLDAFEERDRIAKVTSWLSPANVAASHKIATGLRHAGTGFWFLEGDTFHDWLSKDNSFLWLHAIPGAGKTVLTSTVINYLHANLQTQDVGLSYFYCDYRDSQKQEPSTILGTILASLARQNQAVLLEIESFVLGQYYDCSTRSADFDELLHHFDTFVGSHFRKIFVVIDGLDEAGSENIACLTHALRTLHERCQTVKILVSSRNELPIARAFDGLPFFSIDQSDVAGDITNYITSELRGKTTSRQLKLRDPGLQEIIRQKLDEGANGMFQWATCQIEALCKLRNDKAIRAALTDLPKTLHGTYFRILRRIEKEHPEDIYIVRKILGWLVCGARSLTLSELAEAISIDPSEDNGMMDFDAVDNDPRDILEILGGMVTVSTEGYISLAHFSVKEYLVSEEVKRTHPTFWIGSTDIEARLASVCLRYLCYDDFDGELSGDEEPVEKPLTRYKFLEYAAQAWPVHARKSEQVTEPDVKVADLTMRFLDSVTHFETWTDVCHRRKFFKHLTPDKFYPLYLAASFGLSAVAKKLLKKDQTSERREPFRAAVAGGHVEIVDALLHEQVEIARELETQTCVSNDDDFSINNIADVSVREPLDTNQALYIAAAKGHRDVLNILLDHGADVNSTCGREGTALQIAALEGRIGSVEVLLIRGAKHKVKSKRYGTPLAAAAEKGHETTVTLLLTAGADPNGLGGWYQLPLVCAIVSKNLDIVRSLIENGADVNARGGRLGSPLMAAAHYGMTDLIRELVDYGARVNDEDDKSSDALYFAALAGRLDTVQLLLQLGADVNALGGKHRHALGAAAAEGHLDVVHALLDAGADVEFIDEQWGNALYPAAQRGHVEVVRVLVLAGMDAAVDGGVKGSPLSLAASTGQNAVIRLLYELGLTFGVGVTTQALVAAALGDHASTVELLIQNGADPELYLIINSRRRDSSFSTPMQAAASKGHLGIVTLLLELGDNGFDTCYSGSWYGTALIAAIDTDSRSLDIVRTLLDAGADPNRVTSSDCHCYGFPLLYAVRRADREVVELLLNRGAQVNLRHETVYTALQVAATHKDGDLVDVLLGRGADVNIEIEPKNLWGTIAHGLQEGAITALQTAVWHGHENNVHRLINAGASISVSNEHAPWQSAMQIAAYRGNIFILRALLQMGCDVNEVGGYLGSALQAAASQGHLEAVNILLESGADVEDTSRGWYRSPLVAASSLRVSEEQKAIIYKLIDHGANVNAKLDLELPYVLQHAIWDHWDDTRVMELLLEQGADPNLVGGKYGTALQLAAYTNDLAATKILISYDADPNATGGMFHTPLQAAYTKGAYDVINELYARGARNNQVGGLGGSVMGTGLGINVSESVIGACATLISQLVSHCGFDVNLAYGPWGNALQNCIMARREDDTFYYILNGGADVNKIGGRLGTALCAAAFVGDMVYLECLLQKGAQVNVGNHNYPNAAFGAIKGRNFAALTRLLEENADVMSAQGGTFGTALQLAAAEARGSLGIKLEAAEELLKTTRVDMEASPLTPDLVRKADDDNGDDKDAHTSRGHQKQVHGNIHTSRRRS
ncbi:hypothetical protein PLICBS_004118 [Purpureocillium lilacinum]|uniref:uncharacterized protein n=1 Tax=Purpureocillium lilacinum TaxID=33203 RepID=UPI002088EFB5|nr:hypothetical protein PLICBS_004118 [Purpureocillium lilacinum]